MAEKRVSVRLAAVGGRQVRAELEGVGEAGSRGFGRLSREMEAANARIGVARAAMFPALTIGADAGGIAGTFADVFRWSSRSWLLGAALSMPLIDGGRSRYHVVNVREPSEVDEQLCEWLTEAYLASPE